MRAVDGQIVSCKGFLYNPPQLKRALGAAAWNAVDGEVRAGDEKEMDYTLYLGDCLKEMDKIPDDSIDAIIADLPYGTTACAWDSVIPFEPMWAQFKRVIKERGAVVLFGSQPFTSALVMSNAEWFKYVWVWSKNHATGVMNAAHRPLKQHEDIVVFSYGRAAFNQFSNNRMTYNPQGTIGTREKCQGKRRETALNNNRSTDKEYIKLKKNYPKSIIKYNVQKNAFHPTQKPVALIEYLVKTYTNPGETVLDCTMGSGTTGVACGRTGRKFIGIELLPEYFEIAENRIMNAYGDYVPTPKEVASGQLNLFDSQKGIAP